MRTIAPVMVVFSLGVALLMVNMAGFGAVWGTETPQSQVAQDELNDASSGANPEQRVHSGASLLR